MANTHSLDLESGSSQYADRADTASLSITGDMTIEAWVNRESDGGQVIFSKWTTQSNQASYLFQFNATHVLQLYVSSDGSTNTNSSSTGTVQSTDGWTHVAVTYDASAGTTAFYINGSASGTGSSQVTSIYDSTARPAIGTRRDSNGNTISYFDGLIDEVRVWNDIRTSGEISSNYQQELVGNEAGLVAYYKLNNDYTDETSNSNDLTASGSPVFSTDIPDWPAAVGGNPMFFDNGVTIG